MSSKTKTLLKRAGSFVQLNNIYRGSKTQNDAMNRIEGKYLAFGLIKKIEMI